MATGRKSSNHQSSKPSTNQHIRTENIKHRDAEYLPKVTNESASLDMKQIEEYKELAVHERHHEEYKDLLGHFCVGVGRRLALHGGGGPADPDTCLFVALYCFFVALYAATSAYAKRCRCARCSTSSMMLTLVPVLGVLWTETALMSAIAWRTNETYKRRKKRSRCACSSWCWQPGDRGGAEHDVEEVSSVMVSTASRFEAQVDDDPAHKTKKYLVKWMGLSYSSCTYETAADIEDADKIVKFELERSAGRHQCVQEGHVRLVHRREGR